MSLPLSFRTENDAARRQVIRRVFSKSLPVGCTSAGSHQGAMAVHVFEPREVELVVVAEFCEEGAIVEFNALGHDGFRHVHSSLTPINMVHQKKHHITLQDKCLLMHNI